MARIVIGEETGSGRRGSRGIMKAERDRAWDARAHEGLWRRFRGACGRVEELKGRDTWGTHASGDQCAPHLVISGPLDLSLIQWRR
ncbi:hypothetical protein V6N13_102155 [Hibiscus sabdariffa]|uniref:Uncharacterized protein n=1 Tax=Hibiscus sabdariffa TaxID=183260 RepID=A0ABR2D3Z0_9ROSI